MESEPKHIKTKGPLGKFPTECAFIEDPWEDGIDRNHYNREVEEEAEKKEEEMGLSYIERLAAELNDEDTPDEEMDENFNEASGDSESDISENAFESIVDSDEETEYDEHTQDDKEFWETMFFKKPQYAPSKIYDIGPPPKEMPYRTVGDQIHFKLHDFLSFFDIDTWRAFPVLQRARLLTVPAFLNYANSGYRNMVIIISPSMAKIYSEVLAAMVALVLYVKSRFHWHEAFRYPKALAQITIGHIPGGYNSQDYESYRLVYLPGIQQNILEEAGRQEGSIPHISTMAIEIPDNDESDQEEDSGQSQDIVDLTYPDGDSQGIVDLTQQP